MLSAPLVAVSAFAPAVLPRVHDPTVATPDAFVVVLGSVTFPPPPVTAKTTAAPATGLFAASVTSTLGGTLTAVPAVAVCAFPVFRAIDAGAPTPTLIGADVATPWFTLVNNSTREPGVPVIERFVKVASPAPFVVVLVVPPSVPPPLEIDATMLTPDRLTGFDPSSVSCTPGWATNGAPEVALDDGCVPIASRDAAPVRIVIADVVRVVTPGDVSVNTSVPVLPL